MICPSFGSLLQLLKKEIWILLLPIKRCNWWSHGYLFFEWVSL